MVQELDCTPDSGHDVRSLALATWGLSPAAPTVVVAKYRRYNIRTIYDVRSSDYGMRGFFCFYTYGEDASLDSSCL